MPQKKKKKEKKFENYGSLLCSIDLKSWEKISSQLNQVKNNNGNSNK